MKKAPRIVLGVTVDLSLRLMNGFPEYLASNGWDVHVVATPGRLMQQLSSNPTVTVHPLAMERDPSPLRDLAALFRWVALLRRVRPDVISVGTPKAALLGMIAAWLLRVPDRVYHLRGLRFETASGFQRKILRWFEQLTIRLSTRVLSVSHSLRTLVINFGLVSAEKITVLGAGSSNGVQLEDFGSAAFSDEEVYGLRESLGLVDGVPVVGYVGRLTEDKGLLVLSSANELLASRDIDFQLLVVGEGNAEYLAGDRRGRPVIITGFVNEPAIFYRLIDVLTLPTYREGYPNVVLEAGASGLPTVTTDATGAVDSVVDGETGIIVKAGDSFALAEALGELIQNETMRIEMGKNALRHVQKHFARRHIWELLRGYYES